MINPLNLIEHGSATTMSYFCMCLMIFNGLNKNYYQELRLKVCRNHKHFKLNTKMHRLFLSLDIFIAGSLQYPEYRGNKTLSTGLDLALLSLCNHTITSYGSYSFWASFLAGEGRGKRIIPQFFTKYRLPSHRSHQLSKHPFRSKLPRFFHGVKNIGR